MILQLASRALDIYYVMLLINILSSWFPQWNHTRFMQFIYYYTEPFLGLFRRIVPSFKGFDFSPILAFISFEYLIKPIILRIIHVIFY